MKKIEDYILTIVDFPHEGIMFRDVTTLFADPRGFRMAIDQMLPPYAGLEIDKVVGLEARGFILGGAIAHQLSVGFVPIRKKGKLPGTTISQDYTLEYGEAIVEIHDDAIKAGEKVLVVDDLLATGGTAEAGIKLLERLGAEIVSTAFKDRTATALCAACPLQGHESYHPRTGLFRTQRALNGLSAEFMPVQTHHHCTESRHPLRSPHETCPQAHHR